MLSFKEFIDVKRKKALEEKYSGIFSYDGVQDQMLLSESDSRSHIYQYNMYVKSKN